ncbi:MAG: energy-coupled thiamine transporter ThiT [Oscillospiraceae bacterium]|nr:energy-coupled thiamine transporter ThiT [Oscillospiraceae bacterium]
MQQKSNIKRLCVSAIMIALATVLSLIKVYTLPLGGSITLLSMLPIVFLSVNYGLGWGFFSAFVYSLIQMFLDLAAVASWGLTPAIFIGCIVFDYILAYTALGIAGMFRKKGTVGVLLGVCVALFLRFLSHFLSGVILFRSYEMFNSPFLWSLFYNGSYMLPEMIFTAVGMFFLFKNKNIKNLLG